MRIRDALIVIVGIIAVIFGWLHEGAVTFRPAFVIPMDINRDYSNYNPVRPIITDLDGDGNPEMVATDGKNDFIGIFPTSAAKRNTEHSYLKLVPQKTRSFPGAAIAMAAGFIDPYVAHTKTERAKIRSAADEKEENDAVRRARQQAAKEAFERGEKTAFMFGGKKEDATPPEGKNRKQFIAVLTEYYSLRLLDHNLQELWNVDVYPTYKAYITPHSGSILIRPERIYEGDRGCVVVSVPVGGPNGTEVTLYSAYDGLTGSLRWSRVVNDYAVGFDIDGKRVKTVDTPLNQPKDNNATVEPDVTQLTAEAKEDREGLILDTNDLSEYHKGEVPWEHFRESMIATLPHQFTHQWDYKMLPAAFYRNKAKRKHGIDKKGNSKEARIGYNKEKRVGLDDDDVGELGQILGGAQGKNNRRHVAGDTSDKMKDSNRRKLEHLKSEQKRLSELANVIITHSKDGVHAMHLYTGQVLSRLEPLKAKNSIYHDIDDDYNVDEITNYIGTRQSVYTRIIKSHDKRMPNIVRHGIEQEVLCKGMIFSGVPSAHDALYNATICDTPGLFSSMHMLEHFIRGDGAEETPSQDALTLIGSRNVAKDQMIAVPPCVVQRHLPKGNGLYMVRRYAIFLVDTGLVTALDPVSKRVVWRTQTESAFEDLRGHADFFESESNAGLSSLDEKSSRSAIHPHLTPYVLHSNPLPVLRTMRRAVKEKHPYVLAVGSKGLSLLNTMSGRISSTVELPHPPHGPTIIADFNGDGVNDIVVLTKNAIYGLTAHSHTGGAIIPMLMITLVALIGLLFLVREVSVSPTDGETNTTEVPKSRVAAFFAGASASFSPEESGPSGILPTTASQRQESFKARKVKRSTD